MYKNVLGGKNCDYLYYDQSNYQFYNLIIFIIKNLVKVTIEIAIKKEQKVIKDYDRCLQKLEKCVELSLLI